jgi:hypothetical protein
MARLKRKGGGHGVYMRQDCTMSRWAKLEQGMLSRGSHVRCKRRCRYMTILHSSSPSSHGVQRTQCALNASLSKPASKGCLEDAGGTQVRLEMSTDARDEVA